MGRHIRLGMAILTALSLGAAMDAAEAAHKTRAHAFEYCGDDFCHQPGLGEACRDIGKGPGQKILLMPFEKPICYCICP